MVVSRRILFGLGLIVSITTALLLARRTQSRPTLPVVTEPYVTEVTLLESRSGKSIDGEITLAAGTGFYAELRFVPGRYGQDRENFNDPTHWPFALELYRKDEPAGNSVVRIPFLWSDQSRVSTRTKDRASEFRPVPVAGTGYWTEAVGYAGPLRQKMTSRREELQRWTYFTPGTQVAGDYVFDVIAYPDAHWLTRVRAKQGSPVVVYRGALKVVASAVSAAM